MIYKATLEFLPGTTLENAFRSAKGMQDKYNIKEVCFKFNGKSLIVKPTTLYSEIEKEYFKND